MLSHSMWALMAIVILLLLLDYHYFGLITRFSRKHKKLSVDNKEVIAEISFDYVVAVGITDKRITAWFLDKDIRTLIVGVTASKVLFDKTRTSALREIEYGDIDLFSHKISYGFLYKLDLVGEIGTNKFTIKLYQVCLTQKSKQQVESFINQLRSNLERLNCSND